MSLDEKSKLGENVFLKTMIKKLTHYILSKPYIRIDDENDLEIKKIIEFVIKMEKKENVSNNNELDDDSDNELDDDSDNESDSLIYNVLYPEKKYYSVKDIDIDLRNKIYEDYYINNK